MKGSEGKENPEKAKNDNGTMPERPPTVTLNECMDE
jgi:hypothetical protein